MLRGREEVDAELRLLRDAHETRVRDAARALEEERRRDAETNAHAVAAAEAGVTAALDEARDAVEAARAETRDAAAAFSLTLTLRAWWMSAKHEGERARRDAVAAAANPKRRALKRETLRRWLDASPKPNDARRARRARVNRLRLVAWLAWRREAPAREARARAAETRARATFVSETRDASRGGSRVDRRDAIRDASTHRARAGVSQDEGASPEGDDRGVARVETRRRRFSTRDGDVRREATGGAVTRHRQDVVHASVLAQTREYPRERREATVLDVQIRANSSGVVRRRAVAVRRSRGDGVVRQTQTSRDAPTMSRRVANARRRGNSRREQRRKGFQTPRDTSRARVRLRLARGGVRARARGATRARVADAKATRRVLGVVRFRTLSRATSAWAEEAAEARRRRVAVRRCVSRRDRRATARAFDAWARERGAAADLTETAGRMYRRVTSRRLRRASFYAWRRRADAHAAAWVLAGRVREGIVAIRRVIRPWFAFTVAVRESRAEATRRFARREAAVAATALAAFRCNAQRWRWLTVATEGVRNHRVFVARSNAFGAWAKLARDTSTSLERHAEMRKHRVARLIVDAWFRRVMTLKLERTLAKRRLVAMRGYKKVGAWRLVERTMVAWCEMTDAAARGRFAVQTMRRSRVARLVVRRWRERVLAARAFHATFRRAAARTTAVHLARHFFAWRVSSVAVVSSRDEIVREAKKKRESATRRRACRAWAAAVADAARDADATDRAVRHAVRRLLWRVRLGFAAWRSFANVERRDVPRERRAREGENGRRRRAT